MDKKEIVVLLLGSAVIGATFSALVTALNSWRERVFRKNESERERDSRQNELALRLAAELSKSYLEKVSDQSKGLAVVPELAVLGAMYNMLRDVLRSGVVSEEGKATLRELSIIPENLSSLLDASDKRG